MSKKEDFEKKYGNYLEKAEKAMETMIRDSEEHAAEREKFARESTNIPPLICPTGRQYHIDLYLSKPEIIKVMEVLEPNDN